jgi:hypothetical protein
MEPKRAIGPTWQRYFVGTAIIAAAAALRADERTKLLPVVVLKPPAGKR